MSKLIKRKRGQKIGPCQAWKDQRQAQIAEHRRRILEEMKRITKAGLDVHTASILQVLEAGVQLSNELYLTEAALERWAIMNDKPPAVCREQNVEY